MKSWIASALACLSTLTAAATADNTVSFGNIEFDGTNGTVEVLWTTDDVILAGIQFELAGASITEVGGGLLATYDWSIAYTEEMVLGYAFGIGTYIPAQPDTSVLLEIEFEAVDGAELSFQNVIFADNLAEAVELDATDTIILDACQGDLDGDGATNVNDLLAVIAAWNTEDPGGDADGNGYVDVADLLVVISAWGPC